MANQGNNNKWILRKPTIVQTPIKMRLFCFPPAGSGSWVFMEWSKHLPASVEVCPVELPGRNTRMGEQPYHSMDDLVKNAVDALSPILSDTSKPYSLFGHSLGAWMAFEISREIAKRGNLPLPLRLYASANRAPSSGSTVNPLDCEETRGVKLANMPEKEFWRHWELRYGEHQAVKTGDPFFSNMFYKLLQADIQMAESYSAEEDACAPCPIVSMMAADETRFPPEHFVDWKKHCPKGTHVEKTFREGGHFYIMDEKSPSRAEALTFIAEDLKSLEI